MGTLHNKIALVTGSGRGIGRAVALLFARQGATLVLTARTAAEIEAVAAQIQAEGGQALALAGDLTDAGFVEQLFAAVRKRFGRLDILVNNAGIAKGGKAEELSATVLRETLEINVIAPFLCMQHAIRLMQQHGSVGKIINVGSVRSHWTEHGDAGAYNASKYALRGMTESIARQLHATGQKIAVGLLCPGVVDTTLTNHTGQPKPEWLQPETVAEAVLHAVIAPDHINVFDTVLFSTFQKPW